MKELTGIIDDVHSLKVLVVDDKLNMRRTVKNMMRSFGFKIFEEADDGDVALHLIQSQPFDLIVCDWNMPRMKGVELLRAIRADKKYDDIAFLMVTGEIEENKVAETIEAEVDSYILKPFKIATLEKKIIQIMTRRRTPSALEVQFKKTAVALAAGQYSKAHKELDQAAQIRPKSPMLYYQRGLVFEAEGKLTEAEKCYNMARQLGPLFLKAYEKLAHICQHRGRTAEVCTYLGTAAKISPNNSNRQIRLGRALLSEKRFEDARAAFKKAMDLDRSNQERKLAIGQIYLTHGLEAEAVDIFKRFVEEHKDNTDAFNRLGILLRRLGRHQEALDYYLTALKAHPTDENLHFNAARVYLEIDKKDLAASHLRHALEIDPEFKPARQLLATMKTGEY